MNKKLFILRGLLAVLLLTFFVYFHWGSYNAPWERDEGEYSYAAWLMRSGDVPYRESFLQKPPMIIYTYMLGQLIDEEALWPPKLIASIFTIGSILSIGAIGLKLSGELAFWAAMYMAVPMLSLPHITGLAANTEKFMLLPMMVIFALHYYKLNKPFELYQWVFCGALFSLSFLYKPISLLVMIFVLAYRLLYERKFSSININKIWQVGWSFAKGAFIVTFLSLFYFIAHGALGELWESAFEYNRLYAGNFINIKFGQYFQRYVGLIGVVTWPIVSLAGLALILRVKNFIFFTVCIIISLVTVFSSPINHYYLLAMPFVVILAALGLVKIVNYLPNKILSRTVAAVVVVASLVIIIQPFYKQLVAGQQEQSVWIYGWSNPFYESLALADFIQKNTNPQDKIFIAGSEAQIYYYAKRRSASRFVITYPLKISTPKKFDYQQELLDTLQKEKPKMILLSRSSTSGFPNDPASSRPFVEKFDAFLNANYRLVAGQVQVNPASSYFRENPTPQEIRNSPILLFKLNS
ncbi:MAG: hypothetical protein IT292_07300 [Deltaproteobacteria bacterium]|nr:hypothetical protein [Deltaproteobacteria bacterium]